MNNKYLNLILFSLLSLFLSFGYNYFDIDQKFLNLSPIVSNQNQLNIYALTLIRILTGLTFIKHGHRKIMRGPDEWIWMGKQMKNFGITGGYLYWGLLAILAEFGGGLALTLGYGTRFYSFLLVITMLVAMVHHIMKGDSWGYISFPLGLMIVFLGLFLAGSGPYSLDAYFSKLRKNQ